MNWASTRPHYAPEAEGLLVPCTFSATERAGWKKLVEELQSGAGARARTPAVLQKAGYGAPARSPVSSHRAVARIDSLIFLGSSGFRKQWYSRKQSHQEALNTKAQCLAEKVSAGRLWYWYTPAPLTRASPAFAAARCQGGDLGQGAHLPWPGVPVVTALSICTRAGFEILNWGCEDALEINFLQLSAALKRCVKQWCRVDCCLLNQTICLISWKADFKALACTYHGCAKPKAVYCCSLKQRPKHNVFKCSSCWWYLLAFRWELLLLKQQQQSQTQQRLSPSDCSLNFLDANWYRNSSAALNGAHNCLAVYFWATLCNKMAGPYTACVSEVA